MSVIIEPGNITFTNTRGQTKFSLEKRMPHIIYDLTGLYGLDLVLRDNPRADFVERTDELVLIRNSLINNTDYFLLPFFKINGGLADTGSKVVPAIGSTLLREIRQPSTEELLGTTIITPIVEPGVLKLQVKHSFNRQGYTNIIGDDVVNISYRIYYGRFS